MLSNNRILYFCSRKLLKEGVKYLSDTDSIVQKETLFNDSVVKLTLNDPGKRNSLSLRMLESLRSELRDCSYSENIRAIILDGKPPVFSAGHDLRELRAENRDEWTKIFQTCTEVMKMVQDIQIPVIAGVKGVAAAAGCQLAASCDVVVAADNSRFSVPGIKAGLFCTTPAVAVARALPRKIAMLMLLTGDPISAQEAQQHGLVSSIVPEDQVDSKCWEIAEKICQLSRPSIAMGKMGFYSQIEADRNTAYRLAERVMLENLEVADCQEGIDSFVNKRKPKWNHKFERIPK